MNMVWFTMTWSQQPKLRHAADPIFDSLRRAAGCRST